MAAATLFLDKQPFNIDARSKTSFISLDLILEKEEMDSGELNVVKHIQTTTCLIHAVLLLLTSPGSVHIGN